MPQTIEPESASQTGPYIEKFASFEKRPGQPDWMHRLRKAGLSSFTERGFPTLKDEDWRFTNVSPIAKLPFRPAFDAAEGGAAPRIAKNAVFASLPCSRMVFVNGQFSSKLSSVRNLPKRVKVTNLASAITSDPALVEAHLGRYAETADGFAGLNQAFFLDGAFVYVPNGVEVPEPLHLLFVAAGAQDGTAIHPRNLVIAGAGSRLTIIESYVGEGGAAYLTNAVTELVAGDNAQVELLKAQDESPDAYHVARIHGEFGSASNVSVHSFALGARISRNNIRAKLAGEGLECVLNGLYLTKREQIADHHMIVEHAQPHCASHEYFNGILDDKSKGVFHGRIVVRQLAQKTDAKQTNKNLLLADTATVDTKPQLEIYADDVKCTHGATIGQLNEESIFYLRSRGIGTATARRMLIHAFAGEIIERIHCLPAREELDRIVWDRLEANLQPGKEK